MGESERASERVNERLSKRESEREDTKQISELSEITYYLVSNLNTH